MKSSRAATLQMHLSAESAETRRDAGRASCGVSKLGHGGWSGLSCGPLVFVDEAAKYGPTLDPLQGRVRGGVVGSRRVQSDAAVGATPVVVGLVLGQDRPQVP